MFNKNFYPTPKNVITKMVSGIDFRGKTILEPSAGKGDIVNFIKEKGGECYCIEQQPELVSILQGDNHKVISYDFLTYQPDMIFDYIVMNPPFDNGHKHLEMALEIGNGAEIICLLNQETILNPSSKSRELLKEKLEKLNYEYELLGDCFKTSERSTGVKVVMLKVKSKVHQDSFNFNFEFKEKHEKFNPEDIIQNDLVSTNEITKITASFDAINNSFKEFLVAKRKLQYHADTLLNEYDLEQMLKKASSTNLNINYNDFLKLLKMEAWRKVFKETAIEGKLTSQIRSNFNKFQGQNSDMAFSDENIKALLSMLLMNKNNIYKQCIESAFDLITKYYKENRYHPEGWKTNSQWKVNKKFILPGMLSQWDIAYQELRLDYTSRDKLDDIEKSLSMLEGKDFRNIKSITKELAVKDKDFGKWYESEYFYFKIFKKGTGHFKFKNEILLEKFNQIACRSKNWIGAE